MTSPDGSYADLMNTAGPISVDEVVRVGIVVANALQATHAAGRLHLRLTPADIRRGEGGPMLTDAGGAAPPARKARKGRTAVDAFNPYASPEVLLDEAPDARSDVYSLASTMWTLLAGHPPFAVDADESPDPDEYRERVLVAPAPAVPVVDVPGWLQVSLRRAMAKRPEDRYPTAAAFADALRSHSNEPWAAIPAPVAEPVAEPMADPLAVPRPRTAERSIPRQRQAPPRELEETSAGPAAARRSRRASTGDRVLVGAILVVGLAVLVAAVLIGVLLTR